MPRKLGYLPVYEKGYFLLMGGRQQNYMKNSSRFIGNLLSVFVCVHFSSFFPMFIIE
jgi:hypothetical protein